MTSIRYRALMRGHVWNAPPVLSAFAQTQLPEHSAKQVGPLQNDLPICNVYLHNLNGS